MKNLKPTVTVVLDTRRPKESSLYPIKLRVTLKGERKYYPLAEDCSVDTWNVVLKTKGGGERVRELRILKSECESKALSIISDMEVFTFKLFERQYVGSQADINEKPLMVDDVLVEIQKYADDLLRNGKISSKESYSSLLSSLKRFTDTKKIQFDQINIIFLKEYESWMRERGCTNGKPQRAAGIGIYMRNLRCIVNHALTHKLITNDIYPFGKDKYHPPVGANIKKALNIDQLRSVQNYSFQENSMERRYRDLWLFSYLCNGMNIKDICQLKWDNIRGDVLYFTRAKTEHTRKQPKPIRVIILRPAMEILERWGNSNRTENDYVFDFLKADMTPTQTRYRIQSLVKSINLVMKKLGKELGIDTRLTTYVARHSYASQLLRSNVPPKLISDGLGHTNLATTQSYLADFDEAAQREYSVNLL